MPDPDFRTVSATQVPALWNRSPWLTRFMLWHQFRNRDLGNDAADARMAWGKRMQPLLLEQVAEDLRFEVEPTEVYVACASLGATRDARILCPERGPGSVEAKVCFDYRQWMERWSGGERPPEDTEIQLQIQMLCGDGPGKPHAWGVVAVWLAGEMHYFERVPEPGFWREAADAAEAFLSEVAADQEPEPFGDAMEIATLAARWPEVERKTLDLTDDIQANVDLAETARMYGWARHEKSSFTKLEKDLKAKILALTKDFDVTEFPGGVRVDVRKGKPTAPKTITADMVGKEYGARASSVTVKVSDRGEGEDPWRTTPEQTILDAG